MSTRARLSVAAVAAFVTAMSPAVRAQMAAMPVVIENPDESKRLSINVRGKLFRIWHLRSSGNWQMMSYVIETGRLRKLIVIDGGTALDAKNLKRFIELRNANGAFSVAAWFITHQHTDHFGALNALIQTEIKAGQIGTIFGSFIPVSTIQAVGNEGEFVAPAQALNDGMERVGIQRNVDLVPGNIIWIDGVKIEILGARNMELAAQMEQNFVNDSSLVFRVSDGARSILFTGDLGRYGARKLLAGPYRSRLPSDYVQMAHHGSYGATPEFYQQVNARYCLWPTQEVIWTRATGSGPVDQYTAAKTRATVETETLCGRPGSGRHFLTHKLLYQRPQAFYGEIVAPGSNRSLN
jgi:hypothetical protein